MKAGLRRTLNKRSAYEGLLRKFVANQAGAANAIRQQMAADDREAAERTAHTLKGVAGTIGARLLQDRAAEVEQAVKSGMTVEEIEPLLEPAQDELGRLVTCARIRAGRGKDGSPRPMSTGTRRRSSWIVSRRCSSTTMRKRSRYSTTTRRCCVPPAGEDGAELERSVSGYMLVDALAVVRRIKSRLTEPVQP